MRMGGFGPWRPEWSMLRLPGIGVPVMGVLGLELEVMGWGTRPEHVLLTLEGMVGTPGVVRAGFLSAMSTMDLRTGNRTIAVPTTVIVGQRDRLTPPRLARQLAASIEGSRLVVLPRVGHMLPLEAPEDVLDAILATVDQRAAELPVEA